MEARTQSKTAAHRAAAIMTARVSAFAHRANVSTPCPHQKAQETLTTLADQQVITVQRVTTMTATVAWTAHFMAAQAMTMP